VGQASGSLYFIFNCNRLLSWW